MLLQALVRRPLLVVATALFYRRSILKIEKTERDDPENRKL